MHTQAIVLKYVCTCPCNYVYQQKHRRAILVHGQLIYSELDHIDCHAPTMSNSQKEMSLQLVTLLYSQHSLASSPTISSSKWDTPSCGRRCLNWTWCLKNWTPNKNNVNKPINSPMEFDQLREFLHAWSMATA